jgi:hypothetical protein
MLNTIGSKSLPEKEDILFLPMNEEDDSTIPSTSYELITTLDAFLPQWILSPRLREIVSLTS